MLPHHVHVYVCVCVVCVRGTSIASASAICAISNFFCSSSSRHEIAGVPERGGGARRDGACSRGTTLVTEGRRRWLLLMLPLMRLRLQLLLLLLPSRLLARCEKQPAAWVE